MNADLIVFILAMLGLCAGPFALYYGIGVFFEWVNDRLRQRFERAAHRAKARHR